MMARRWLARALACALVVGAIAPSASADGPRGTWRWKDDARPVKAVVIGGSISAWVHGSFSQYLGAVCAGVEIVNKGKSRLGAAALYDRFRRQVIDNRRVDPAANETWLVWFGGLNSIGTPELTNDRTRAAFVAAHEAGMKVVAFTLGPWGSERDRRWANEAGLAYFDHTVSAVDFVMGRSTPAQALGRYARGREAEGWDASERADVAIDLWDSPLRHADAPLRGRLDVLARRVERSAWTRARVSELPEDAREAAVAALVTRAAELPRWFMRPEYIGFDAIHPNAAGHRVIAQTACPSLPASWRCDCAALEQARWDRKARAVVIDEAKRAR